MTQVNIGRMTANTVLTLVTLLVFSVSGEDTNDLPRLNVVQLSGTKDLDNLTALASNVWSVLGSGFLAAVLVTGALYLLGAGGLLGTGASRRVSHAYAHYGHDQYGQDRVGRRQQGVLHQLEKILSYLSAESLQDVVSSVKHEILGGLSSMRDDSLQRVDLATNAITDGLSDGIDALGGGSKLEDCILQAICYMTPDEEEYEAGESRKNKEKQKRREEKRKEKKNKKNKKNKHKDKDYTEDYVDNDVNTTEAPEDVDESDELTSEDCDVFRCDTVRYGYQMVTLYGKIQNLRSKIDTLKQDSQ